MSEGRGWGGRMRWSESGLGLTKMVEILWFKQWRVLWDDNTVLVVEILWFKQWRVLWDDNTVLVLSSQSPGQRKEWLDVDEIMHAGSLPNIFNAI
ncbi:predicted protein [Histoplasma mississippiense (nom. inval.)]|uniref:predicted protein n=1 Tax=Ajellomyces capsulatus (strain NAm1 / WU24) TaxID=2059318 RepID=UPI000157D636|nr:predicted protein [Histoplasma mississippiense (nom. inval.)]EDN06547.1 predicted protein [Histoplasma mississippiense (nom. inval.)]